VELAGGLGGCGGGDDVGSGERTGGGADRARGRRRELCRHNMAADADPVFEVATIKAE